MYERSINSLFALSAVLLAVCVPIPVIAADQVPSPISTDSSTKAPTENSLPEKNVQPAAQVTAPAKKFTLYGRLEEVSQGKGLRGLKAETPKFDLQTALKASTSFPSSLNGGIWDGRLKVYAADFTPLMFQLNANEASQEKKLLAVGTDGHVFLQFQTRDGKTDVDPIHVDFERSMSDTVYGDAISRMIANQTNGNTSMEAEQRAAMAMAMLRRQNYSFALHLGDLTAGKGVAGNDLYSQPMEYKIKEIAPGVFEKTIVSYIVDKDPQSNSTHKGYSESVIRVTPMKDGQLYVQGALINYDEKGALEDRIMLSGTLQKAGSRPVLPDMPKFLR